VGLEPVVSFDSPTGKPLSNIPSLMSVLPRSLTQAYGAGASIPEAQVQVLGPASRTATADDVSVWNITEVDTLAALMSSADGNWEDPALVSKDANSWLELLKHDFT